MRITLSARIAGGLVVAAALAAAAPPAVAAVGGASSAGTCRDPQCARCDQAALAAARAEFQRRWGVYKDQSGIADRDWDEAAEAYAEANAEFEEYMRMVQGLAGWAQFDGLIRQGLLGEAMRELARYEALIAVLTGVAVQGVATSADMIVLHKTGDRHARQAQRSRTAAIETLGKAIEAHARMRELEATCEATRAGGGADGAGSSSDAWKSSAEREAEAARAILDTWTRVESGYLDLEGNFWDARLAFEEAQRIVQSGAGVADEGTAGGTRLAGGPSSSPGAGGASATSLSESGRARAAEALVNGVARLHRARAVHGELAERFGRLGDLHTSKPF